MPATSRLTYAEFSALPREDNRILELLDGELIVSPGPSLRHQVLAGRIYRAFEDHFEGHGGGQAVIAPIDVKLSDQDLAEPDIVVILADRYDKRESWGIHGAPSLVIEVLSSNVRYDRVRKKKKYEEFGIPEYWIVDPESDRVEIYRLAESNRYAKPEIIEPGEMLEYGPLHGFRLDVSELMKPELRDR